MGARFAVPVVVALAFAATLVDFAGRALSMLADGVILAGVVWVVLVMHREHRRVVKGLREELKQARAGEIAASRSLDAMTQMQRAARPKG